LGLSFYTALCNATVCDEKASEEERAYTDCHKATEKIDDIADAVKTKRVLRRSELKLLMP
jgi:hypothetical protein